MFFKIIAALVFSLIPVAMVYSQETPGLIESLETLIEVHRKRFDKQHELALKSPKILEDLEKDNTYKITPLFLESLLLYSKDSYLNFAALGHCELLNVIQTALLRTAKGQLTSITLMNKDQQIASTNIKAFINYSIKKECSNVKESADLFSKQFIAQTISRMTFNAPKNINSCTEIVDNWKSNFYLPFICRIDEVLNNKYGFYGNADIKYVLELEPQITSFKFNYIRNLCSNLDSPEKFCAEYLQDHIWGKVTNGEEPQYKMISKCLDITNKDDPAKIDLTSCAKSLSASPEKCETAGSKSFNSFFPRPNCDLISDALLNSKLITKGKDCPGRVFNDSLTTFSRLLGHVQESEGTYKPELCDSWPLERTLNILTEFGVEDYWGPKICYHDVVESKEVCENYIPGGSIENPKSELSILAKVLIKSKGAPRNLICKITEKKKYIPHLLEYRHGCFIVFDATKCSPSNCPRETYYNKDKIDLLKYKGKLLFPLIGQTPTASWDTKKIFEQVLKIDVSHILNLSELKFHLAPGKKAIAFGIACAEDLMPGHFVRYSLNQCQPTSFIVDGIIEKNNQYSMVTRLGIDEVHSPRIIPWQSFYSAIKNYSIVNPYNNWALYVVKK
jgi:hypothetical protein